MDLLLLNDRLGGRLKEGGVVYHRFIKPNRRLRGTEYEQNKALSDTFLSSVGTRMLMDAPVSGRKGPVNIKLTETSSDQNDMFLINVPTSSRKSRNDPIKSNRGAGENKNPPKSVRSLYNDRFQKELETSAGRALREHIGGGHIVLMESTPRAQRVKKELARKLSGMLEQVPEGAIHSPITNPEYSARSARKRDTVPTSRSTKDMSSSRGERVAAHETIACSARLDSQTTARQDKEAIKLSITQRSTGRGREGKTARSERERDKLNEEVRNLEKKLSKIENLLEVRSTQSQRSTLSARSVKNPTSVSAR